VTGNHASDWDNRFSSIYSVSVVFIMLGSMLQIYLFSPCFNQDFIMYRT
jgi:hypothetical protein